MHFSNIFILSAIASGVLAAPAVEESSYTLEKRGTNCVLGTWTDTQEYVGAPSIPKREPGSSGSSSSEPEPAGGSTGDGNTLLSDAGISVGLEGSKKPLWQSGSFNFHYVKKQTIKASDTKLPKDITYQSTADIGSLSFNLWYDGKEYKSKGSGKTSIVGLGTDAKLWASVTWPCK